MLKAATEMTGKRTANMNKILKLKPVFKDYLWGGTRLRNEFGVSDLDKVAEAWILSTHKDGTCTVDGGEYDGMMLSEVIDTDRENILGKNAAGFEFFPQMIKLIDAADDLSVQVHPDDAYALKYEKQYGKSEMWYILDAVDGAGIYYGFKDTVTAEEVRKSLFDNSLTDLLKFIPVKKGECYFIPSGTVHAIGKGLFIAEIQQNSNVTYRVYDYGRKGADGKPRELHVEKALEVACLSPAPANPGSKPEVFGGYSKRMLSKCPYFTVSEVNVSGVFIPDTENCFVSVVILDGNGTVNGESLKAHDTYFIPAGVKAEFSGKFAALVSTV